MIDSKTRNYTIHISDYWYRPDAGSYAGSDEWTYHKNHRLTNQELQFIKILKHIFLSKLDPDNFEPENQHS